MEETTSSSSCKSANSNMKEGNLSLGKSLSDCRLWIGNLDSKVREFNLLKMVEKFGPLAEFDFLYHRTGPQIGQPRGYAFVTYKELEHARKAQKTLDGLEVFSRKLAVKWAHAQDEAKFITKPKVMPPILTISKETPSNSTKKVSKEKKIAALEEQLKLLEEKSSGEMAFTPDIGAPSKPTTVIYNYIERNPRVGNSQGKLTSSYKSNYSDSSRPYNKRMRRK
ncbi:UNVERIFIED_CONTAM: hypothetical protein RMT77_006572 [Armadillidium vulgare]